MEQIKDSKKIELDKLNKENEELENITKQLEETERRIQNEKVETGAMTEDVENLLNEMTKEKKKQEEEEAKRIINERDLKRKKLEEDEKKLEEDFSLQIQGSVSENQKLFGYIKRYVLIGLVTGIPGIAITYLFDKWEENCMVKDLYQAHIDMIQNPNNVELERIYQRKKLEFSKVYNIEKIEKFIKESEIIPQIKTDKNELIKLRNEIEKAREIINQKLEEAMENEAKLQEEYELEQIQIEEEYEEELERIPPQN